VRAFVGVDALEADPRGSAVTIGTFDGVHVGHRALLARAQEAARELGCTSVAVTWDRHPAETLRPDKVPPLLTSSDRKVELLRECGIDVVAVLPFDEELSTRPPERFVEEVLVAGLGARHVVVGKDWRFGHRAAGDVALLAEIGRETGFDVEARELVEVSGEPASSSRTRRAVAEGELELARLLLGRPFDVDAEVIRGDDRGKTLGFPTANLARAPGGVLPPRGIYAGRARAAGSWYPAAISIGVNPTFGGEVGVSPVRVEAHLIDFSGDLYGELLRLEFWSRLRDELAFESIDELVAQMQSDVEATRTVVAGGRRPARRP
jgi:riboflavin kinase / FMN adenylyltransferase